MKFIAPVRRLLHPSGNLWRKSGALLCLLLLAILTTVAVAHIHHGAASDIGDQHCQLCQLSHSPANAPMTAAMAIIFALTSAAITLTPKLWMDRTAVRDITARPPPASH